MDNADKYMDLCASVARMGKVRASSVSFIGSASPEGTLARNSFLARQRAVCVMDMLRENFPEIFADCVEECSICYMDEGWKEVMDRLGSSSIDGRGRAVDLIRNYIFSHGTSSELKTRLMSLSEGRTWASMYEEIFPYVRSGSITITFEPSSPKVCKDTVIIKEPGPVSKTSIDSISLSKAILDIMESMGATPKPGARRKPSARNQLFSKLPTFAFKTNVLSDMATAFDVELEIPFGRSFSIDFEYAFPWWQPTLWSKEWALEQLRGGVEFRWWPGEREKILTGKFLGIYAASDYFDLEKMNYGFQGSTWTDFGISFGYVFPLGDRWRLETGASLGWFGADVVRYHDDRKRDMLIFTQRDRISWVGPTKLKCCFSCLIPNPRKK